MRFVQLNRPPYLLAGAIVVLVFVCAAVGDLIGIVWGIWEHCGMCGALGW
jgi:hypothetical protein